MSSAALRVMVIAPVAVNGGAGQVTARFLATAAQQHLDPLVVALRAGPMVDRFADLVSDVRVIDAGRLRAPLRLMHTIRALRRLVLEERIDVLYATEAKGQLYAGILSWWTAVPCVWRQPSRPSRSSAIDRLATRLPARGVIVASEFVAAEQRALAGRAPVHVITPGIDLRGLQRGNGAAARLAAGIAADAPLVVIVGRLQTWKGQDLFLRAAARVSRALPESRFAIVGGAEMGWERGDYPGDLRRLARSLGLEQRVVFTGHTEAVADWYDAADIVVSASDHEPFGLVLPEAMARAKPVVAVSQGGPREIIDHGRTGVLVARQPSSLADAVIGLLRDPERRARMGEAARDDALQRFDQERMGVQIGEILRKAAPGDSARDGMRRVLVVLPVAVEGGAGQVVLNLAASAEAAGGRLTVVALADGPILDRLRDVVADVHLIPAGRLRSPASFMRAVRDLRRIIRETRPDAVIANEAKAQVYIALAGLGNGVPSFWFQHALPSRRAAVHRLASALPTRGVIVASRFVADHQRRLSGSTPIHVVTPGVDLRNGATGDGAQVRSEAGVPARAPLVITVGRLQEWKGQDLFLLAAARVRLTCPDAWFAVVGGAEMGWERGSYPEELRALADELGIADRVIFTGQVPDVSAWYDAADVVVNASENEPFGLVIVEAMMLGAAVVAIAQGGPREIVEHERTGLLAARRDPALLSAEIVRLLTDIELRSRVVATARAEAVRSFSSHRMARDIMEVVAS